MTGVPPLKRHRFDGARARLREIGRPNRPNRQGYHYFTACRLADAHFG